jgi:hypothetical protein
MDGSPVPDLRSDGWIWLGVEIESAPIKGMERSPILAIPPHEHITSAIAGKKSEIIRL